MFQHNLSRREATSPSNSTRFFGRGCSTTDLSHVESSLEFRQLEGTVDMTVYLSQLCDEGHAHLVLRSALASQQRILEYHVLSEERCQPPSRDNVFHEAVWAVHRRALEGYFLWAKRPVNSQDTAASTREHITTMFIETLLMYVLQAISEQLLHTPELLNAFCHILREKKRLHYGALCQIFGRHQRRDQSLPGAQLWRTWSTVWHR